MGIKILNIFKLIWAKDHRKLFLIFMFRFVWLQLFLMHAAFLEPYRVSMHLPLLLYILILEICELNMMENSVQKKWCKHLLKNHSCTCIDSWSEIAGKSLRMRKTWKKETVYIYRGNTSFRKIWNIWEILKSEFIIIFCTFYIIIAFTKSIVQ